MPKVTKNPIPTLRIDPLVLKKNLTTYYYLYANKVSNTALIMLIKYNYYYKEKVLKCFIDTITREYVAYIVVYIICSLWISKKEWERV